MSETFGVRGRVLDEAGRPLAGVRVLAGPDLPSAETGADGRFTFEGLERSKTYWMWAREDDFYTPFAYVTTDEEIELRMRRGITVIARVFADKAPLPGATVALGSLRAVTDEHGIATLRGVPHESFRGNVTAAGRATHFLLLNLQDVGDTVVEQTIDLERGVEVSGRVVDERESPVRGVQLMLTSLPMEIVDAFSDAAGRWRVAVRAGRHQVLATSRTHLGRTTIDCDGQTAQRDLVIRVSRRPEKAALGRIAGSVVDQDGQPAVGAHVRVPGPPQSGRVYVPDDWSGRTDQAGHFETEELGAIEVEVRANWGWLRRDEVHTQARVGDREVKLVLPTGATLVGRALLDGAPLSSFGYRLEPASGADAKPIDVKTDDGRFAIPHVAPGTWRVGLLGEGTRVTRTSETVVTANETIDLGDIELARGHRLSGVVRDRTGTPVANARVVVGRLGFHKQHQTRLEMRFLGHSETRTDETGSFVFDGLPGPWQAALPDIMQAHHPVAGYSQIIELPETNVTHNLVLHGRGRIEGVTHTGAVFAERGDEPRGARMGHCEGGRFALDVPPGDYTVRIEYGDDAPSTHVTVLDGETANLTFAPK